MNWSFGGNKFSWGISKEGKRNLSIDVAWSKPVSDFRGPNPEFELQELWSLFDCELRVDFTDEGNQYIENEARALCQYSGQQYVEIGGPVAASITLFQDKSSVANITVALSSTQYSLIFDSFLSFAGIAGPKQFVGVLSGSMFFCEPPEEGKAAAKKAFLAGDRAAIFTHPPTIRFVIGSEPKNEIDRNLVLQEIKAQFL